MKDRLIQPLAKSFTSTNIWSVSSPCSGIFWTLMAIKTIQCKWDKIKNQLIVKYLLTYFFRLHTIKGRHHKLNSLGSRLSVSGNDRKSGRTTSGISDKRDPTERKGGVSLSLPNPACHAAALSIVSTDRDPRTGFIDPRLFYKEVSLGDVLPLCQTGLGRKPWKCFTCLFSFMQIKHIFMETFCTRTRFETDAKGNRMI